jgi:copper chaperone CopZ
VRSALLEVKGVTRVQASLERKEAIVTYDPQSTTLDALVAAVNGAPHPAGDVYYSAAVKGEPRRAPSP